MKINHKKLIKRTIFFIFLGWLLYQIDLWLSIDSCMDFGNVWDYAENRCRKDCLLWNEKYGCVQMPPEMIKLMDDCRHDIRNCNTELLAKYRDQLCAKYGAPKDPETGICYYEH